jgi:hypothetical protein
LFCSFLSKSVLFLFSVCFFAFFFCFFFSKKIYCRCFRLSLSYREEEMAAVWLACCGGSGCGTGGCC